MAELEGSSQNKRSLSRERSLSSGGMSWRLLGACLEGICKDRCSTIQALSVPLGDEGVSTMSTDVQDDEPSEEMEGGVNICIMSHGMGGNKYDWDVWVEMLHSRFPDWVLWPLGSLAVNRATDCMGSSLRDLANQAATEIIIALRTEFLRQEGPVTLQCVGHSMGGLIIRGALPRVLQDLPRDEAVRLRLGHFMSLSSPHLGIKAGWAAPHLWWKNLCKLTSPMSPQLPQLAVQDGSKSEPPYLVSLADINGPYIAVLRQFRTRTCVTMTTGDALIPFCSGLIQAQNPFNKSLLQTGFSGKWRFEARTGTPQLGAFEKYVDLHKDLFTANGDATPKGAAPELPHSRSEPVRRLSSESVDPVQSSELGLQNCQSTSSIRLSELPDDHSNSSSPSPESGSPDAPRPAQLRESRPNQESDASPAACPSAPKILWRTSLDGCCQYPGEALDGLSSMPWQRIPTTAALVAKNMHVFLIGKKSEQRELENKLSRECIRCLVEIFAADELSEGDLESAFRNSKEMRVSAWCKKHGFRDKNIPKRTWRGQTKTALHTAVKCKDEEMVGLLLGCGIDRDAKDSKDLSPAELAERMNVHGSHEDILKRLRSTQSLAE